MNAIEITDLKKSYENSFEALKGVSLSVAEGDFFALLGPNGAGKSTLIGILTSLVMKTSGKVKVFDADIDTHQDLAKTYLGVVPQEFNFSIFEPPKQILVNQAGYYGIRKKIAEERAEKLLNDLDLADKKNLSTRLLSGGMKRRLMIARALIHQPRILILDEPTAGVDIELRKLIWNFLLELNRNGTTIILTTHYLEEAEYLCRNIAIINGGEIIENTSKSALLKKLNQQTYLLDLSLKMQKPPVLKNFRVQLAEPNLLEVVLEKKQSINELFVLLEKKKIKVTGMRMKTNRLEELFLNALNREGEK